MFYCCLFDEVEGYHRALESRECKVVPFGVGGDVDQNPAADDAAVVDPCYSSQTPIEGGSGIVAYSQFQEHRLSQWSLARFHYRRACVLDLLYHFSVSHELGTKDIWNAP